jgi:DNA polymerase-1
MDYRKMFEQMEKQPEVQLHKNSRVLIVDSLNTFLRNFAAIHHINPAGNHIGGLGGFLKSIGAVIKQIQPTRVILVFDGQGGSTNKRYLYPEYKANRHITKISNWDAFDTQEEESESITNQIVRLVDYLKCLPVDLVAIDKIEADDVIGYLAQRFFDKVFILSTDQDYLQLVSDNIAVYSPIKKVIYNQEQVLKEYGIPPHNFLTHKVIVGDKGDNVPGVKGIAIKTLLKMFPVLKTEDQVDLKDILNECLGKDKKFADIYNYRNQLEINKQLMDLKDPNIPEEDREGLDVLIANPKSEYDPTCFLNLYREDQLGKTLTNPQLWLSETFAKLTQYELKD